MTAPSGPGAASLVSALPRLRRLAAQPQLAAPLAGATTAVRAVHTHRSNMRGWARSAAAASVRAARASATLDGGDARIDADAEAIADPVLAGALRVSAALGHLVGVWQRSPRQALARLHLLAARDLVADADQLGRPAAGASAGAVLASVTELVALGAAADPVDALLLVGLVHAELLRGNVFGTADGVVARAAARLTAMTSGLDPRGLCVPEVGMLRAGERYRHWPDEAAGIAGSGAAGIQGPDDERAAQWLLEHARWWQLGAAEGQSIARLNG